MAPCSITCSGAGTPIDYRGFDVSEAMIDAARTRHAGFVGAAFTTETRRTAARRFAVASGIFNVKLRHPVDEWRAYVLETLGRDRCAQHARICVQHAVHVFGSGTAAETICSTADPCEMFDLCKRRFATRVALLHDYPLFEFTVIVRK